MQHGKIKELSNILDRSISSVEYVYIVPCFLKQFVFLLHVRMCTTR